LGRLQAASLPNVSRSDNPSVGLIQPAVSGPDPAITPGGMGEYERLQRQLLLATLALAVVAVPLSAFLLGGATAISLSLGALAGLLYLKLLARSVARIGPESRKLGKSQLLVPVVLVLAASRIPGLEIVPALVGFLLYKPAILLQVFLPD